MANTTCEINRLQYLFQDLGIWHQHPAILYCDNQAADNLAFHERTKHIEVREKIQAGRIQTAYLPSKLLVADIFTKALGRENFTRLISKLGLIDNHAPT